MPESSPLQPWLCLPRVLAAALPLSPPWECWFPWLGLVAPVLLQPGREHPGCATPLVTLHSPRGGTPVCHSPAGMCILTQGFSAQQKAPLSQHLGDFKPLVCK